MLWKTPSADPGKNETASIVTRHSTTGTAETFDDLEDYVEYRLDLRANTTSGGAGPNAMISARTAEGGELYLAKYGMPVFVTNGYWRSLIEHLVIAHSRLTHD